MKHALWPLVLVVACGRKAAPSTVDAGVHAAAPSVLGSASPAATASAAVAPNRDPRLALVERWNTLLNAHDSAGLLAVYASQVNLYGAALTRERAAAAKAAAFAKQPDYAQTLGRVTLRPSDASHVRASFDKSWSSAGKTQQVVGSLQLVNQAGHWLIGAENDQKTELYLKNHAGGECWELVASLVAATKEASTLLNGPTNPDAGHETNGLRVALADDTPTADIDVHESHTDHLVPLAWFEVNLETGVVKQTSALDWQDDVPDGRLLATDPHLVSEMRNACRAQVRAVRAAHPDAATTLP